MNQENSRIREEIKLRKEIFQSFRRADVMNQIRAKMIEKNIKNRDVAERLDVSEANISRWLRGNQNVGIDTMYQLADAVGVDLNIIVGEININSDRDDGYQVVESDCEKNNFEKNKSLNLYCIKNSKFNNDYVTLSRSVVGNDDEYYYNRLSVV